MNEVIFADDREPLSDTVTDDRLPAHLRALLSGSDTTTQFIDRIFAHVNGRQIVADVVHAEQIAAVFAVRKQLELTTGSTS